MAGADPDWAWASTSGEKNLKRSEVMTKNCSYIEQDISFDVIFDNL